MLAEAIAPRTYTEAEYLELEAQSPTKHELVNGTLHEMAGESLVANEIALNLALLLKTGLRGQPYRIFNHDVKLKLADDRNYRYPDVMVVPKGGEAGSHLVAEAILTAEITSDNSHTTDTTDKLHEYTALESLQCYLIISQTEPLVEVYERTADTKKWLYTYYTALTDSFTIASLNLTLSLSEVYEGVFE